MRRFSLLSNMALASKLRGGYQVGTEENKAAQRRIIDEV